MKCLRCFNDSRGGIRVDVHDYYDVGITMTCTMTWVSIITAWSFDNVIDSIGKSQDNSAQ